MPAVKKLKPINFIVKRDLVISALAVYGFELHCYKIDKKSKQLEEYRNKQLSELLEFKGRFYQNFNAEYNNVLKDSILLLIDKVGERIDVSQKDTKKLFNIYDEYISLLKRSEERPVKLNDTFSKWLYKGFAYEIQGHYSEDEIRLLILEDFDKERRRFEKLRAKFDDVTSKDLSYERSRIPEKVRIEIWRRDGGKCARCGSRERLEYDHIVPISKGGSNTARNIELLCEKHNRSKSNNVV